jgi:hypothetical protein
MLFRDEDATTKLRRGLLNDFDYTARLNNKGKVSPGHVLLFLSTTMIIHSYFLGNCFFHGIGYLTELRWKKGILHEPQFDLESLFYVLIYLCLNLKGPENRIRPTQDLSQFSSFRPRKIGTAPDYW